MEERRYRPVGGGQDRRSDVRIIAATNENLHKAVAEKRFRADLLYRLQDFTMTVPALCHCPEDILPLADFSGDNIVKNGSWKFLILTSRLKECCWNIAGRAMCVN